jgi:uroporphyrinogen decarboxylase
MNTTHRERVLAALAHREADRVPWDLWATPEVMERLRAYVARTDTACRAPTQTTDEDVLRHFDVDLRSFYGPSQAGQDMGALGAGRHSTTRGQSQTAGQSPSIVVDLWGVKREVVTVEGKGYRWTYKHLVESPLASAETARDVDAYRGWPDPAAWDFSTVADTCRKFKGYAVVNQGDRLDRTAQLKPAMYLRGVEQILVDLALNEAVADAIFEHIYQYFMEYNRRVFDAATVPATASASPVNPQSTIANPKSCLIDIFMMGDDFGTQHGPMVSPDTWRRFFKRRFRSYIDLAHSYGIRVMHHTCGSVRALIPEFIDCGLDILQSVQPQAEGMDLAALKREFGKHIAFHGSIDIQGALPGGTPADVRREVQARMAAGKPGGGFIISTAHNILPDTPTENIVALFDAYREFGGY